MSDNTVYWYAAVNEDWTTHGYCKMGITQNLVQRKSQYQTTSPKLHTLTAVLVLPASRRTEIDDKLKKCLASMGKNVSFQEKYVGEEFYWYTDENEIGNLFKTFSTIDNEIRFLPGELFNEKWERKDEQLSMPPQTTERHQVHKLPARIGTLIKNASVKCPEYYQKFLEVYDRSPFPAERYTGVCNEVTNNVGITFVIKARGTPINKPPSYGENDILRGRPLDPSDIDNLLLWQREVGKIPRDERAVNGNITKGNGNLSALIGHFIRVHHHTS